MKLVLHYLKFDWKRWCWLVVALWGLVALHSLLFGVSEWTAEPDWSDYRWRSEGRLAQASEFLTDGILLWAMVLIVLAGAADSPVGRRTWLLTRAGDRRLWIVARLGFVFLTVVLPLTIGYAVMPLVAGFDGLTVLHSFWLALELVAPLTVMLWLWVRAWPQVPALLVGGLGLASLWMLGYASGVRLPGEWFALFPSLPVAALCLTLPALICLGAAGKQGRPALLHSWVAGVSLPVMWVVSAVLSCGLRTVFPGRLERVLFASGGDWKLTLVADVPLDHEKLLLRSEVPFLEWNDYAGPVGPSVWIAEILATSWQREGGDQWSPWRERPAGGSSRQIRG